MEQQVLSDVPLATERFEDALPLLPGVVRGPDGLLNMNGARADQSSLLMNGINMTDPVTGHFAVRLPLEAIETMNVHAGVYSAAYGNATGGVTNIAIRPGQDKLDFQVQNFMPRFRFHNGIEGFNSFTPRVRILGPIDPGRMWFSQAMSYRFVRSQVDELSPRGQDEQKVKSLDSEHPLLLDSVEPVPSPLVDRRERARTVAGRRGHHELGSPRVMRAPRAPDLGAGRRCGARGCERTLAEEEMKVKIWQGFAIDFSKQLAPWDADAENVGILKFGARGGRRLVAHIDALVAAGELNAWAPMAFRALAQEWPLLI